jgi:hypothetical protein
MTVGSSPQQDPTVKKASTVGGEAAAISRETQNDGLLIMNAGPDRDEIEYSPT